MGKMDETFQTLVKLSCTAFCFKLTDAWLWVCSVCYIMQIYDLLHFSR